MSSRRIKQGFMLILVLISMLFLIPKNVQAASKFVEETQQQEAETTADVSGGVYYTKSGWLINLVDENAAPVLGSRTCFFGYNNVMYQGSGIKSWGDASGANAQAANAMGIGTPINHIAFINVGIGGGAWGGDTLACKLQEEDPASGTQYANEIIIDCLGVDKTQFLEYLATGKPLYLQLTGIYWCKTPVNVGSTSEKCTGSPIAGNTVQMANYIPQNSKRLGVVSHRGSGIPNCAYLEAPAWGITNTSPLPDKQYASASELQVNGWGVGMLEVSDSYQVVICIENTITGKWTTTYLSSGLNYTVLDPYQGATFVEGCVNKRKTKEKSASSTYTAVRTNVEPGGQETRSAGVGAFTFNTTNEEHALFLHYKTKDDIPEINDTDLFAWELGYRMPQAGSDGHTEIRTKADAPDYGVKLDEVIETWQNGTKPAGSTGELVKYQWVVKKKSVKHTYKMSGSQGDFSKAIWNLYRATAPHYDLWDKYNDALGDDEWNGWDKVDPKFSYYLMRSQLEGLALRPVPSSGLSSMLVAGKGADFADNWKDLGKGASQTPDTVKTWENVCTYEFSYTGKVIDEETEGRAEAWIIWKEQKATRTYHSHGSSCSSGCNTVYNSWSGWSDTGEEKEFTQTSFSPDKWNGTYASYNIDKYKVQQTGTGRSETAGNQSVASGGTDGLDKDGNLASQVGKGGAKTLSQVWGSSEIHNAATSSSQFKNTIYNLYGEIEMLYWKNTDTELYKEPLQAQNVYVMSEYERHIIPPLVHGFKTSIVGGQMKGMGSLTTPATGKTAIDVKNASNPSMGVTYMGTGFNVATTSKYRIDFGTAGLTISANDDGANAAWNNKKTDVKARHSMYMGSVLNGVGQEIIMEFTFKPSGNKVYYTLLTSDSAGYEKTTQDLGKDDVSFKRGSASGGNGSAIDPYTNGGVDGYLALTRMFDGTMISENESYEGQDNNSGPAHENALASHSGQYSHISYSNWYDEESNHRFCIEKYHSWVIFDYVIAEDKIDYNLLTQNVASKYLNQSKYIEARFYTRLFRANEDYTDGLYSWPGAPTLRVDKIKDESTGSDLSFSVINESTSDMKKK